MAAMRTKRRRIEPPSPDLPSSPPARALYASTPVREIGQRESPPTKKPIVRTIKYLSARTITRVEEQAQAGSCRICWFITSNQRIKFHILQHYAVFVCPCDWQHVSRDQMLIHHTTHKSGDIDPVVYLVDQDTWEYM